MICVVCEILKYPREKLKDENFVEERINEFYPQDEYENHAWVCEDCHQKLLEYFLHK